MDQFGCVSICVSVIQEGGSYCVHACIIKLTNGYLAGGMCDKPSSYGLLFKSRRQPYQCSIRIWNVETGDTLRYLTGHDNLINCLLELRDGRLVSDSLDCTIKFWDISGPEDLYSSFSNTHTIKINELNG